MKLPSQTNLIVTCNKEKKTQPAAWSKTANDKKSVRNLI